MRIASAIVFCVLAISLAMPSRAETIWVEGEDAVYSRVHRHRWWYDQVDRKYLSGGEWISNFQNDEGLVEYRVRVEKSGSYKFWVRANPRNAQTSYRVNEYGWTEIDFSRAREKTNIALDNRDTIQYIAWIPVGEIWLKKGLNYVGFRFHSEIDFHGGLDCFVLTNEGFTPKGIDKPNGEYVRMVSAPPDEAIWIEGENPVQKSVSTHPWWYDQVKKEQLSNRDWLHHYSDDQQGVAFYEFDVLAKGTYTLWLRANPVKTRLAWSMGDSPEKDVPMDEPVELRNIAADGEPDLRFIAWTKVGEMELEPGKQEIRFRFHSPEHNHGAIDCMVFARIPFEPREALKPASRKVTTPSQKEDSP